MVTGTLSELPETLETRETSNLISSRKVEGTFVYNPSGESLGSIESFMVNKTSGQVEYAVLQFGGILGIGSDYYPIPWQQLRYSPSQRGYVINIDRSVLEKAPRFPAASEPEFDANYDREIEGFYVGYPPLI